MAAWNRRIAFQVDIGGVIEILGSALYSRPDSAIRELIQNAHDAIERRRRTSLTHQGRIDIEQDPEARTLRIGDDGVGLSVRDAETYLSTLGVGITGLIRGRASSSSSGRPAVKDDNLIGFFGIGLFSAFMLASRVVVESRKSGDQEAVRWEAGPAQEIELSNGSREAIGTTVTLYLKPEHAHLSEKVEPLEAIVKEYADFLKIPIHINEGKARVNLIHATWFEPTPDREAIELELESYFGETPLDVIPIRREHPCAIAGALYVTPRRTPGFAGESVVTATVRRMVVSRQIQGLLPSWGAFLRGVLELNGCTPTLSREDLVRDPSFDQARQTLETLLFEHFEALAENDPPRLDSILAWHRYSFAGAALSERRLRDLLRRTYPFLSSRGSLSFVEILRQSEADPLHETDADHVVWYNTDRRQEGWANALFSGHSAPCVHTLRGFEESLLASMIADEAATGGRVDLRLASPGSPGFASMILGVNDVEEVAPHWQEFLGADATILCATFRGEEPVMAFLNERAEFLKTLDDLKREGTIPSGFQRMIDAHLGDRQTVRNEVLLNRRHRLVARALSQSTAMPLAAALRMLVGNALTKAGAAPSQAALRRQAEDLDWITEALWGRNP